ncbi:MAG TPA: hypothetical protein VKY89_24740 [Thermoanaerobaculia bacterium]|jgi:hypothetical protein|nr:hypothetical protein [Thermoanaerobaculia bacterium]
MILTIFTAVHVLLSLTGILAGFVVLHGMLTAKRPDGWTAVFLWSTAATTVTGFLFPFHKFLPSHATGIVSVLVLGIAIWARSGRHLEGAWRRTYAITAVIALYLNVFVLVVQLFLKVPALNALAPTGTEPPFLLAQLVVLALFVVLGWLATVRFGSQTPPSQG